MDPNVVKHVTADNITSEDIKPEGRTDGPKNFGPEFVTGPGGKVVPTRPAEQVERVARKIAEDTRAEGGDEAAVAQSFAQSLPPDQVTPVPASAQFVPEIVPASMPLHKRKEIEEKEAKKKDARSVAEQLQYDIGVGLANDHKALPLEASDALIEGYEDTREGMQKELQRRREGESSDLRQHEKKSKSSKAHKDDPDYQAGFDAGQAGKDLPEDANASFKAGHKAGSK